MPGCHSAVTVAVGTLIDVTHNAPTLPYPKACRSQSCFGQEMTSDIAQERLQLRRPVDASSDRCTEQQPRETPEALGPKTILDGVAGLFPPCTDHETDLTHREQRTCFRIEIAMETGLLTALDRPTILRDTEV